jgi:tRNA-(ms[2]io[6]A)-hydroxylase
VSGANAPDLLTNTLVLGLKVATDPAWASIALADLDAVLVDHAHCEMKAASNAMALAARNPRSTTFVLRLVELAREELDHFSRVVVELEKRGISLGAPPVDGYAAELRKRAAPLDEDPVLVRLIVAALIEARSCERFKLLLGVMGDTHPMFALYTELFEAEARHYRTFLELAEGIAGEARVQVVLERALRIEAEIVRGLGPPSPVIHG